VSLLLVTDPEQQLRLLYSSYHTIETCKDDFEAYVAKYQGGQLLNDLSAMVSHSV
jgi:hypothetical protein